MSLRALRPVAQRALRPVVRLLATAGVTPNALSLTSTALALVGGASLAGGLRPAAAVALLGARLVLDVLDGELARATGRTSRAGAFLNDVGDGLDDVLLYGGLALGMGSAAMFAFAALGAATELVAVAGLAHGAPRSQAGPLGKVDRMLVVGLIAAAADAGVRVDAGVVVATALVALTLVRRLVCGVRRLA